MLLILFNLKHFEKYLSAKVKQIPKMRFLLFKSCDLSNSQQQALQMKTLLRFRLSIVDICSDTKHRVIALLDQIFPEYETLFSDTFGVSSKELFLNFSTPNEMMCVSTQALADLLYKVSKGRFGMDKAQQIQQATSTSFSITYAKDAFAFQIKQLLEQIIFSQEQLQTLGTQIAAILHQSNQVISIIPGIGDALGAVILGEISDIYR